MTERLDMTGSDVSSVNVLIDSFGDALQARDLEASLAQLDDGSDVVVIPSEGVEVHRGREEVRSFLSRIYSGPRRYRWLLQDRTISVEGRAAWFTAVGDEIVEDANGMTRIPYCLTGAAVKTSTGWRLRLLHASEDATRTTSMSSR